VISRLWEATTAKRMQIDRYCQCQRRKCSPVNVVSSDIRVMQKFAGVREIWGVKQESGRLRCQFSYLSLAIFSKYIFIPKAEIGHPFNLCQAIT